MKKNVFYLMFLVFLSSCHIVLDIKDDVSVCGNGIVETGEECDATNLNNQSCSSLGYESGVLQCNNSCNYDLSNCEGNNICGNGVVEAGEECDATNLNNQSCSSLGHDAGTLQCDENCKYDFSYCNGEEPVCGNGIVETGEECDATNLNYQSCSSLGHDAGTLQCDENCKYDFSYCNGEEPVCGNGVVETGEECDTTNLTNTSCIELDYYEGELSCKDDCLFDTSDCENYGKCGDGIIQEIYGEECDGNVFSDHACQDLGYWWGTPASCNSDCIINDSTGCHYAVQWGSSGTDNARGIFVDSDAIYVTGFTSGAIDGNINEGSNDIFLTKLSLNGTILWTKQWGSSEPDYAFGVTADIMGNVYVTGYTMGSIDGNINEGSNDIFLTKFTPDGQKLWTKQWGTPHDEYVRGISTTISFPMDTYIYITGSTNGSLHNNINAGSADVFLMKIDKDGTRIWTKQWGTSDFDEANDITSDLINIYLTGYTEGNMDGNTNSGLFDIFVTKFTDDGTKLWTKQLGTSEHDEAKGISIAENSIYITGKTYGSLDGNINSGSYDMFVTKFTDDGTKLWTKQLGGTSADSGNAVISINDNVYISGSTNGSFDGYGNAGSTDIFLTKFTDDGTKLWTTHWGSPSSDITYDIEGNENYIYVAGYTYLFLDDNISFGNGDAFIIQTGQ